MEELWPTLVRMPHQKKSVCGVDFVLFLFFFPELCDALNCTLWQIGLPGNHEESWHSIVGLLGKMHAVVNVSCHFTKRFGV